MFHIITRAYESCFACRTLISNWIDRCFGQHLWNSVHSLSRDNPRIPTNPLSGSQQPPLLWGQWIRTKPCSKLTRPLRPCLIQTEVTFQLYRTRRGVFADGIIRWLLYDDFLWPHTCLLLSHICGLLLCACMCASEKKMVTYLGKKATKQERSQIYVAKNRTSIVSQFWNKWPTIPIVCLF